MKEAVYLYLNMLFSKCKINSKGEKLKVAMGKDVICEIKLMNKERRAIYFSYSEFYFIKNMFGLEIGQTVEYIRDYLVENYDESIKYMGFFPHL